MSRKLKRHDFIAGFGFLMSAAHVALILISSLCWSFFDMSRKRISGELSANAAVVWLMVLQIPLFLVFGLQENWVVPHGTYWAPAVGSVLLNLLGNIWFLLAVRLAPFSLAIPMLSLAPVFSSLGGFLILGEPTSPRQMIGILIVIGGTFFLGSRSVQKEEIEASGPKLRRGLLLMVVVAFLWAIGPVLDKICLQQMPGGEHGFLQCLLSAVFLAVGLRFAGHSVQIKTAWANRKWLLLATVFATAALATQLAAIQLVSVGIFDSLKRSFGLVSALVLGALVFKEPVTRAKLIALVTIAVGIVLLLA